MSSITYFVDKNTVEQEAIEQIEACTKHPAFIKAAVMPDVHTGYDAPIGSVIMLKDYVVPSWVGYDIGCGVASVKLPIKKQEIEGKLEDLHKHIHNAVPCGFGAHSTQPTETINFINTILYRSRESKVLTNAMSKRDYIGQFGTLGTGNHFLEVGYDEEDNVWVTVHSGSRGLGHEVATYWMTKQKDENPNGFLTNSKEGKEYINDMVTCILYAFSNREEMLTATAKAILGPNIEIPDIYVNANHNHAEIIALHELGQVVIHRKGATNSNHDELGVIPGNMRDGVFIVKGLGNEESIRSSSHGAGRVMSRSKAKKTINLNSFVESMKGVASDAGPKTLDESPDAYKDIFSVIKQQEEAGILEVIKHIKPLINIKGA